MRRFPRITRCAALQIFLAVTCLAQYQYQPTARDQESLHKFLQQYLRKQGLDDNKTTRYSAAYVKLHGDAPQQVITYLQGNEWCGSGGCTMLVLARDGSSYRVISRTAITRLPIRILKSSTKGWHDIGVWVQGGGIQPGYEAKLSFNGKEYPTNPSVPPALELSGRVEGEVVIPSTAEAKALYP